MLIAYKTKLTMLLNAADFNLDLGRLSSSVDSFK